MTVTETGRAVVEIFREADVPFMAASIAYYAVASFVPLLLVVLAVVSVVGARGTLVEALRSVLPASGDAVMNQVLTDVGGHGVAGGIGFLLALWSGGRVFRGLTVAFDEIYTREPDHSLLDQVVTSVLALGTILLAFVVLSAVLVTLTFVELPIRYPTLVSNVVAGVVLTVAFLPIFYLMPPRAVTIRHALPGAVTTAIGWVLLQVGFFYYAGTAARFAAYGLLGAVLLFITFLYLGAIVLLIGVVVNAALDW